MSESRQWMYARLRNGRLTPKFLEGLKTFIEFSCSQPTWMDGENIRCPCSQLKCQNTRFLEPNTVRYHLAKYGFIPNYHSWIFQGEISTNEVSGSVVHESNGVEAYEDTHSDGEDVSSTYHTMVMDVAGPQINMDDTREPEESPNPEAQKFYDMLKAADKELWPGCVNHSQLSLVARLMNMKSENNMSERLFNQITELLKEVVPENNRVTDNFYSTKKLLRGMGLPVEKIDCCINNCMIYWASDSELIACKFCSHPRFKKTSREAAKRQKVQVAYKKMHYFPLTPRLQRLYASNATANDMRWHARLVDDGLMRHPADSMAWKHFDHIYPDFAVEIRNIRLGLSTDGFQPFGQSGQQYSSWPVILTPYNLPPWMCMKEQYMFLTILVPGPKSPKEKIDVFLQPLISELKYFWDDGVLTYDVSSKNNFQMRAALMWTISDFPAYSMLSGWSTAGRMACPYCMSQSDAFTLACSGKQSWFDNHRKFLPPTHPFRKNKKAFTTNKVVDTEPPIMRSGYEILNEIEMLGLQKVTEIDSFEINKSISKTCGWRKKSIFWDLPYWSSLLIRHNLDVMHIEKNFFDNVFNTVMNIEGKTKDTAKSREELNKYCSRPELKRNDTTGKFPKACYTLDKSEKKVLCEWVKDLKFPDGYVSNMSRCVDMKKLKLFGMKSHDCHVFMQRIIPIAFRELLPLNVWKALTELSLFFKDLTTSIIKTEDMMRLHDNIPIILCKLEHIFPPSFFDSMEHLPVHLAYEAKIAGPVQYRWMYPFERYLRKLKNNVKNKAKVEGSICNSYLVEESSSFCSYYFEDHVRTRHKNVPRNYDGRGDVRDDYPDNISIFKFPGRAFGRGKQKCLTDEEYNAARIYILLNCSEVEKYITVYVDQIKLSLPNISNSEIDGKLDKEFASWFDKYAHNPLNNVTNKFLRDLAKGPFRYANTYPGYYVNGYKFHTIGYGSNKASMNCGVCIKGANYTTNEGDYYGRLMDVVELEYPGLPTKKTTLFECEWFDTTTNGTKVHPEYKLVDVNHKRKYKQYESFVLSSQASQVYYCSYPSVSRAKGDWWAVCKIKARANVEVPQTVINQSSTISPPFQDNEPGSHSLVDTDDDTIPVHPDGGIVEIEDSEDDTEEEFESDEITEDSDEENIDTDTDDDI